MTDAPQDPKPAGNLDKFKVGCFAEDDGTFTAFIQIRQLPDVEAGKAAGQWLADLLLCASAPAPKKEVIQMPHKPTKIIMP